MQKWYKGKKKVNIGERIKNFWVNGNTIDKALAFMVVLTAITLGAYFVKTAIETNKKSNNTNIRVEESLDNVGYNPKEPDKILCYKRAS